MIMFIFRVFVLAAISVDLATLINHANKRSKIFWYDEAEVRNSSYDVTRVCCINKEVEKSIIAFFVVIFLSLVVQWYIRAWLAATLNATSVIIGLNTIVLLTANEPCSVVSEVLLDLATGIAAIYCSTVIDNLRLLLLPESN